MIVGRTVNYRMLRNPVAAHRARTAWTPAALFAQGQQGVLAVNEPTVDGETSLYQVEDATGAVLLEGDLIGWTRDLSGNDNHPTQGVESRRPIYPGLSYDGIENFLTSIPSNQITVPFTMAATFRPTSVSASDAGAYRVISRGSESSTRGAIAVDGGNIHINLDGAESETVKPIAAGDRATVVCRFLESSTIVLCDGVAYEFEGVLLMSADDTPIRIGRQTGAGAGGSRWFEGDIGGVAVIEGDIGADNAVALHDYLAALNVTDVAPELLLDSAVQVSDAIWSWWAKPCLIRHETVEKSQTYATFSTSNGAVGLAIYDHDTEAVSRSVLSTDFNADDHNTGAVVIGDGRVMVLYPGRKYTAGDQDSLYYVEFDEGTDPEIASFGLFSGLGGNYPNAYNIDGQMLVMCRLSQDGTQWRYQITDWPYADTDIVAPSPLFASAIYTWPYLATRQSRDDRTTINLALGWHPFSEDHGDIYFASIHRTGQTDPWDVVSGGSVVANLTTGTGLPLDEGDFEKVYTCEAGERTRLFDVHDNAVVFAVWTDVDDDARYMYASRDGGVWAVEEIANGGQPFTGTGTRNYYGGMSICDGDTNEVTMSREKDGVWYIDVMRREGGSWSLLDRKDRPEGLVQARPTSEVLSPETSDTVSDLLTLYFDGRYAPDSYTEFDTRLASVRRKL